jgi:uncharacterized membrane protein YphA (DoxX/SURF4 family)
MSSGPEPPTAATEERARTRAQTLAIELLRIGVGIIWALNLVFIVAPQNDWWGSFGQIALSFGPTSLGGPGLPQFVAAHAVVFSWLVAVTTTYLAVAFLLGVTTRWACLVGGIFSAILLGTQVGNTFVFPGGTDVGEHPLYMLIYIGLVVGGAGQAYSLDVWIRNALARRRAARLALGLPVPRGVFAPGGLLGAGLNYRFFFAYFAAGTLIAFGLTVGLMVYTPATPSGGGVPGPVYYENLSVNINPTNGWPQYSPANFTVPTGRVVFTITDNDSVVDWPQCPCVVSGTTGGVEFVNGTALHVVNSSNVAHSFNIPDLGLAVYSPGLNVTRFTVDLVNPGTFTWFCIAPCGAGSNPYSTPPMGTPGWMTGTMTVR